MIKEISNANENVTANGYELQKLKQALPQCFTSDGSFNMEAFKAILDGNVNINNESYELKFLGKSYARLLASLDTETIIVPNEEHNSKLENVNSENIYITGDNLDALKHLLNSYEGKVKFIYIDPPYNTDSEKFVYNDKFNFTKDELVKKLSVDEEQADRILSLISGNSSSHSGWLTFMYPRLLLARDLLSKDGVIFISIDDNEQANLKNLCDNIFGEENFIANIIVQANKRGQTYKQLAKTHEYLFVITKSVDTSLNELSKGEGAFAMSDEIGEFEGRELRNRNPKFGRFNRPNLFYPIYVNPKVIDKCGYHPVSLKKDEEFCIEILPYNSLGEESCWRWGTKKFIKYNCSENSMISEVVAKRKINGEYGCYEKYRKGTYKAKTIWLEDNLISDLVEEYDDIWDETGVITEQGSKELRTYGMGDAFDFPKPTYLIKKALEIGADKESICLDFFSGSATTFEAVMSLNDSDNGNRKIIAVQLPENLDEKISNSSQNDKGKVKKVIDFLDSVSRQHTLDQVGLERIIRAAAKIREEHPETTADLGFKHYVLQDVPEKKLTELEDFDPDAMFAEEKILEYFTKPTVLTTWLVKDGYGFNAKVEELKLADYTAYYCDNHLYFLDTGFDDEAMKALYEKYDAEVSFKPENVVLFGYSFTYTQTASLKDNLRKLKAVENNKNINVIVRY